MSAGVPYFLLPRGHFSLVKSFYFFHLYERCSQTECYRSTESWKSLGWQESLKVIPPFSKPGQLQLDQGIQNSLECFQGWDIHHISGQPVPAVYDLHHKNLLISHLDLPSSILKSLLLALME